MYIITIYMASGEILWKIYTLKKQYLSIKPISRKHLKSFMQKLKKEAVNKALELVVEEDEIIAAHNEIGGAGEFEKIYK